MRFERRASRCDGCPLQERCQVWGEGNFQSHLALFGEAPGREEDQEGHPFVGAAGRFLNWGLFESGIIRSQSWVSNLICCRPPNNEFQCADGQEAQRLCRKGFDEELAFLKEQGITTVLALGNNAMHGFGIEGSIWKNRGSVYQRFGLVVIPTFHPSYLNRQTYGKKQSGPSDQKGITVDPKYVWIADLRKARRLAQEGWSPPKEDFLWKPSLEQLKEFRDVCLSEKRLVAVDIETTGFNHDYGHIVVIGLADSSEHAISVPLIQKGGRPYWQNGDQTQVRGYVNDILGTCPLMFQNAQFDLPFLQAEGYEIQWDAVRHDSMILHHTISPELPHDLGFIVSLYGDTPYWKADLLDRSGSILDMDNKTLRTYNLRDCVVLHQILPRLLRDLEEDALVEIYEQEALRLIKPVGKMEQNGILLHQGRLQRYKTQLETKLQEVETELRTMVHLPEAFNIGSDDDLRWFLFGDKPNKFQRLEELKDYEIETTTRRTRGGDPKVLKRDTQKYRDLLAIRSILDLKPLYVPKGFSGRKTKKGSKRSVNVQGRLSLQVALQNRLREIQLFKKPNEKHQEEKERIELLLSWLKLYNHWAETEKLLSTYTHYPVRKDGRVHGQFLIHGTATGRLAARNPNMQNLPAKDLAARKPFIAAPGYLFLSADYSNLEVRVLAYTIEDQKLIEFIESGGNIHDANTRVLFGLKPGDPMWDKARHAAKVFQFGRIQYGGTDREIFEKVSLEVPELRLTFGEFTQAVQRYMDEYPKYRQWYEQVAKQVVESRTTKTFHGRVRQLMGPDRDILKQGLNTPIQGGAGAIINRAMIRIDQRMEQEVEMSKLILQIHDELVFEVWEAELPTMLQIVKEEMERPVLFNGVPRVFPVEFETGPSLGELKEYKIAQ